MYSSELPALLTVSSIYVLLSDVLSHAAILIMDRLLISTILYMIGELTRFLCACENTFTIMASLLRPYLLVDIVMFPCLSLVKIIHTLIIKSVRRINY